MMNDTTMNERRTRLAPSPTGALHLGNARTFLINWALARQHGWRVVLRIEDLDTPRVKPWANQQAIDVLSWLGMDWDEGPTYQLADLDRYRRPIASLAASGRIYPCRCTRKDIEAAASAPHADEHEQRYPGTCRPAEEEPVHDMSLGDDGVAWRIRVPEGSTAFDDAFAGPQSLKVQQLVGDFVVVSKAGMPAYQLAVAVDDAAQGITDVVRGDDLLRSTPRQMLLYESLDLGPPPGYWHVPLVLGPDGRRLAKRHGDTRLISYHDRGVDAKRVIGLLGAWCGLGPKQPMTARQFVERFDMAQLSHDPVTFTEDDEAWLTA